MKAKEFENDDEEETHYNFKIPPLYPENPKPRGATGISAKAAAQDAVKAASKPEPPKASAKPEAPKSDAKADAQKAPTKLESPKAAA